MREKVKGKKMLGSPKKGGRRGIRSNNSTTIPPTHRGLYVPWEGEMDIRGRKEGE